MSADFSVAPEIAQLAAPLVPSPAVRPVAATAGRRAAELARLAARPTEWWDLVRFDPLAPARVAVPASGGAWLLITPPGMVTHCECGWATLLAGEATEDGRPLRPGRVRLHAAGGHPVRGSEHGYAVSLHLTALR
ncbi:MAG: cysteine dioxygenase [Streptosporangiales bacterium]|nr:cysteine dioxygenase [Streptosporangiales bacterium]